MKCLKNKLKDGSFEYVRVTEKDAMKLVDSEDSKWNYISKEEFKTQSRYYKTIPCKGTFVRTTETRDGQKVIVYKLINEINHIKRNTKTIAKQYPNSSKLSKYSINLNVRRKGKFNNKHLTLFDIYKLPLWKFLEENEDGFLKSIEGRKILKERKLEFIKNFKRVLN